MNIKNEIVEGLGRPRICPHGFDPIPSDPSSLSSTRSRYPPNAPLKHRSTVLAPMLWVCVLLFFVLIFLGTGASAQPPAPGLHSHQPPQAALFPAEVQLRAPRPVCASWPRDSFGQGDGRPPPGSWPLVVNESPRRICFAPSRLFGKLVSSFGLASKKLAAPFFFLFLRRFGFTLCRHGTHPENYVLADFAIWMVVGLPSLLSQTSHEKVSGVPV